MLSQWPAPPQALHPEPGWVHVFRFRLDPGPEKIASLHELLSADEQERAARYIPEDARRAFITARGQMRTLLGAYLKRAPNSLRFAFNPQNKPSLPGCGLGFNLSHSAGMGLLAITAGPEVGVDVESTRRAVDFAPIAQRFFAPPEAAYLLGLPLAEQPRAFFAIWTRKEAYIKARGGGLSIPLDSFTVNAGLPPRLSAPDPGWSIRDIQPGPEYAAALVVWGEIHGLRLWNWE